ncbi:MAG: alpha-E domain-containing protein [Chitinophagaceae bacterium]
MLSRVADSLFWMSRNMERSDGMLRMLKMNYATSQDDFMEFSWKPVLKIFSYLESAEVESFPNESREVLLFMVLDRENQNSVYNIVRLARENARSIQDHISKELWQSLNDFYHLIRKESLVQRLETEDPVTVLDELIQQCVLYYGTADITMARGEGNAFLNIGKHLERGIQSSDILNAIYSVQDNEANKTPENIYWKNLLLSIAGFQLYLKTYRSGFEAKNIVEMIVLNEQFPRSVSYSVSRLQIYFKKLKSERNTVNFNQVEFMIGKLASRVQYSTADSIIQYGIHKYLSEITQQLNGIGKTLNEKFFAYL